MPSHDLLSPPRLPSPPPTENETNWDELNIDTHAEPSDAVRAADRLLRELPPSPRREVLSCYTLMAYKGRTQIDKVGPTPPHASVAPSRALFAL